jgi:hypothetical protein
MLLPRKAYLAIRPVTDNAMYNRRYTSDFGVRVPVIRILVLVDQMDDNTGVNRRFRCVIPAVGVETVEHFLWVPLDALTDERNQPLRDGSVTKTYL